MAPAAAAATPLAKLERFMDIPCDRISKSGGERRLGRGI
jgi:hypothetical protein